MLRRRPRYTPSRPVRFMLGAFLALYLTLGATALFGQELQVRHYNTEQVQLDDGSFEQLHVFVAPDGRMGAVLLFGELAIEPSYAEVSGPRTYTDVNDAGEVAFCFTVDSWAGTATEALLGLVSCWLWSSDGDTMIETGETPFGEVTSIPLPWCGEVHPFEGPIQRSPSGYGT